MEPMSSRDASGTGSSDAGNMKNDGSDDVQKRGRGSYSKNACQRCRMFKKKCDGRQPCVLCLRAGPMIASACIIIEKSKIRPNRKKRRAEANEAEATGSGPKAKRVPAVVGENGSGSATKSSRGSSMDTSGNTSGGETSLSLVAAEILTQAKGVARQGQDLSAVGGLPVSNSASSDPACSRAGARQFNEIAGAPLPGTSCTERAITTAYLRRELSELYDHEVAIVSTPLPGAFSKIHLDVVSEYENQWWEGTCDDGVLVCLQVFAGMALYSRQCKDISTDLVTRAGNTVLLCGGVPTIPLVAAVLNLCSSHMCNSPRTAAVFAQTALELIPKMLGADVAAKTISERIANFFKAATDNQLTLKEKAATYAGKTLSKEEANALEASILEGSVSLDETISKLRASLNPLLFGLVGVLHGNVIRNVNATLSEVAKLPDVRAYGILYSRHEEGDGGYEDFLEWYGDGNVIALLGSYRSVLGAVIDHARRTVTSAAMIKRWEMIVRQLMYTCRVLTCVILHNVGGMSDIAGQCAADFVSRSGGHDFSSGVVGAYVLPIAMMLEYAFQCNNIPLMEGVISHAVALQKAWTPFPDDRREDLVCAAKKMLEIMKKYRPAG